MAYDNASSISGTVLRITQLNADGTKVIGPSASYVTKGFIHLTITPEYEAGQELVQKAADGSVAIYYKIPDTLKTVKISLAINNPDPEATAMLTGGDILGASQGWAIAPVGDDPMPNGVALEVWSKAIVGGKPAVVNPYWHWLVPYANLRQTGDRVIQEGIVATDFTGWGVGNSAFVSPGTPLWAYTTDRAYAYARTASLPVLPTGGRGYAASS